MVDTQSFYRYRRKGLRLIFDLYDLYRLEIATLFEPLSPRSVPLLSLCDIFPVSSGKSTPRGKQNYLVFCDYFYLKISSFLEDLQRN